jgi:serine/threonine protein kinase/nitrous oxidase accessory protein NosD
MNQDSSTPPAATSALPRLGRYQLLDKLGQGGMGEVYLARDAELDRSVALKVLPPESVHDAGAVARFQREARALAKLSHPNIVQAFDSGSDGGRHFLVMEYVEGQSLAALLRTSGAVSPARAADYAHQAALALQHAHDKGLVHRDLKPSNLLLTPQGRVKLLDLGLARFLQDQIADPNRTREGVGLGTPDYAAPEQFRDAHSADARADIYSLGCTLYHLLTGRVPFPGSSLREKWEAHAAREPTPLEELCPEAPAGLVLAVQKMMAKRPADRFAGAAEAAEALAPFVAGSSASFAHLKMTRSWRSGQLTTAFPRRRALTLAVGVAAAAVLVGLGFALAGLWRPPAGAPSGPGPLVERDGGDKPKDDIPKDGPKSPDDKPKPDEPPGDPDVLTVAKTGKARFKTISDALEVVKPGQTVRVLDDAVYTEPVLLNRTEQHAGVTLEAARGATLELQGEGNLIEIVGVPGVTLRGFKLYGRSAKGLSLLLIRGRCPRTECCDLDFASAEPKTYNAVEVIEAVPGKEEAGAVVLDLHHCRIRRVCVGCMIHGLDADYRTPAPVDGVRCRENVISDVRKGIWLYGRLRRVQATGNRIVGASQTALQLEKLLPGTEQILIANNTVIDSQEALRVWDDAIRVRGVQVRNNLFLIGTRPDVVFYDSGGDPSRERGPGDGKALHKAWQIDANWREGQPPTGTTTADKGWAPPGALDTLKEKIDGVGRDPAKADDFLRPEAKSPLASQGAGVVDPSLPRYVGALPPRGAPAWDWDRTWLAPPPGKLLTVSKDPRDKADFDRLGKALAAAEPWATLRVLDAAVYREPLAIDQPAKQTGLQLEAVRGATLQMPTTAPAALRIEDVPHVRVRGFRFREPGWRFDQGPSFVLVKGRAAGFVLEDADLEATNTVAGVQLQNLDGGPGSAWSVVRRCRFRSTANNPHDGIIVAGTAGLGASRNVRIHDNQIRQFLRGVWLSGELDQVEVAGNFVSGCQQGGVQIEDLMPGRGRVLLTNNTAFRCGANLRLFFPRREAALSREQVAVINNLWFDATVGDVGSVVPGAGSAIAPARNDEEVLKNWRFRCNARDFSGVPDWLFRRAEDDRKLQGDDLVSREAQRPDQIRPKKGSPLATQGAGAEDAAFAPYIGALPPEGTPAWDWDRIGSARSPKRAGEKP